MTHYVAKFCADYADEFNVYGIRLFTEESFDRFMDQVQQMSFDGREFYFGTNEFVEFSSSEEYLNAIDLEKVTEEEYELFKRVFGGSTFGHFIDPTE